MDMSMTFVTIALVLGTTGPPREPAQNSQPSHAAFLADYMGHEVRVTDGAGTKFKGT